MTDLYSDYIGIKDKYWAEINPSTIKESPDDWIYTYPHKTFIELLQATERMLARGPNENKKCIWIEGSFGTGKSRVVWTIEMLLRCSESQLIEYFDKYDDLRALPDLRDKLLSAKEDKIVTAYRYASASIDSPKKLIMAVFESVSKALDEQNVKYKGEHTLKGKIVSWLSDEVNKAYFKQKIEKPEYRGLGSFAGKDIDSIINQLNK